MSLGTVAPQQRATRAQQYRQFLADLGPFGWKPLAVLTGLAVVQSFDIAAFGVLSPDVRDTFHLSTADITTIASLTGAFPIFFSVLLGLVGDRTTRRLRLVQVLGLIWGVTAIICGAAPVVLVLVLARLVGGVGLLASETIYPSLLSDYHEPKAQPKVFGVFRFSGYGLGLVGGPLAGVIGAAAGWRVAFIVLALPTFLLVAAVFVLREPPRGATENVAQITSLSEGFRRLKAIPTARRTWLAAFLFGAGTLPFVSLLNTFFKDVYHQGAAARGGISVVLGVGGLVGIATGAILSDRFVKAGKPSTLALVNGGMIVEMGLGLFLLAAPHNLALALIGGAISAIGASGFLPAYTVLVSLITPPRLRSQAFAWSLFFYALGGIVLTATIGGIAGKGTSGDRTQLIVLGFVVVAGGLVGTTTRRMIDRDIAQAVRQEAAVHSDALLSIQGVDAGYSGVQILFGVDLEIQRGEIVALLGTNGAGKSTLLKAISGILDPTAGAITFNGRDITHTDPQATTRAGIVQVPGGRGVFPGMTVADNLRIAGWLYRKDKDHLERQMRQVREWFPVLDTRANTLAGDMSGGEQQQLSLAQAFLAKPDMMLIDELSLGLSPIVVRKLVEIVRAIHDQGTTIILVEQSVNTALELAERAIFMEKGEVRFSGPTADLLERPDILRSVFLSGAAGVEAAPVADTPKMSRIQVREAAERAEADAATLLEQRVVLETRGLVKRYGGVTAVNGVSIELHDGEILGFVGANGAGKTTLFDLISGFSPINGGRVILNGVDVTEWSANRRAGAGLGRSFQDARLWPALTVAESLAVAIHGEAEITAAIPTLLGPPGLGDSERKLAMAVDDLIDLMGLGAFANKFISELSTGSRRMVELAAIVGHRPKVLLLDEPSSGIAQRETEALGPLIKKIRRDLGCSVLVIEHDIPLISSLADHLVGLELGGVIAYGRPQQVLNDPKVVESYLGGSPDTLPSMAKAKLAPAAAAKKRPAVAVATPVGSRSVPAERAGRTSRASVSSPATKKTTRSTKAAKEADRG